MRRGPAPAIPDWRVAAVAIGGLLAYVALPQDLALLGRIVAAAFLVLSLDLLVGFAGVATLGQAALSGIGAYAAANACRLGLGEPVLLVVVGAAAGALAGWLTGLLVLRGSGLQQLVLSIASVQLVHEAANKASILTGGSDGLSGFELGPVLGLFRLDLYGRTAYLLGLACLVVILLVLGRIVRSPFGLLCRAIRQDGRRVAAMGGAVLPALRRMYAISGAVAGVGGALAAITTGVVGLDAVSFEASATALVMLVLGGAGTLYGAVLGTLIFMGFENVVSAASPFHWLVLVGALLIAVVMLLPGGLQELPKRLASVVRQPRRAAR